MHNTTGLASSLSVSSSGTVHCSALSSSTPLAIIPEKTMLTYQIRRTVPAQYWGLSHASAMAPDGASASSISESAPLPLLAGSGLSRPHLVLATQAVKLPGRPSLPGLPSLCLDQGGAVLDRVLAHGSGDSWWATLSGRARLGKIGRQRADLLAAAADPSSYSLCATSRVQLNRSAVLRSRLNWSPPASASTTWLGRRRGLRGPHRGAGGRGAAEADTAEAGGAGYVSRAGWAELPSLTCQLQSRVGRWAEVRADLAVGQRTSSCWLGAGAEEVRDKGQQRRQVLRSSSAAGPVTPLLMGLQAGSVATSRAPLVWRCGVLQVTAPLTVSLGAADAVAAAGSGSGAALQSAMYVQGTLAVQGERVLWQGPKRPPYRRSGTEAGPTGAGPLAASAPDGSGPIAAAHTSGSPLALQAPPPAPASTPASSGPLAPLRKGEAGRQPMKLGGDEDDDEEVAAAFPARSVTAVFAGNATATGKALRPSRGTGAGPASGGVAAAATAGGGGGSTVASSAPLFGIELPSAGAVQEALVDATQSVSRLRDDVTAATQWVDGGGLAEQLTAAVAAPPGASAKRPAGQRPTAGGAGMQVPWSSFVGEPNVKVVGLAGVTARAPVMVLNTGSAAPGSVRLSYLQDLGLSRVLRRRRRGAVDDANDAPAADDGAGTVAGAAGPVARGALRPFCSAAASVQAGRFSGWLLDYTRVSAQLDCGLWGPANNVSGEPASGAQQRHPAFALGDTGAWHALSLSLSQQLVGPLRLAADWRYQLASSRPLALPPAPARAQAQSRASGSAAAAAGSWIGGAAGAVAAHTVGMRPQLVEAVYALDLAAPGTRGAVRLVAWYSPQRREGMLELRMF